MSNQPKPPLSVWLNEAHTATDNEGNVIHRMFTCSTTKPPIVVGALGPFVDLAQFMELVEARKNEIQKLNPAWTHNTCEHVALHNTALEIKEWKI